MPQRDFSAQVEMIARLIQPAFARFQQHPAIGHHQIGARRCQVHNVLILSLSRNRSRDGIGPVLFIHALIAGGDDPHRIGRGLRDTAEGNPRAFFSAFQFWPDGNRQQQRNTRAWHQPF